MCVFSISLLLIFFSRFFFLGGGCSLSSSPDCPADHCVPPHPALNSLKYLVSQCTEALLGLL